VVAITGACVAWALVARAGTGVGIFAAGAFPAGIFAGAFAAACGAAFAAGTAVGPAAACGFDVSVVSDPHATAITNKSAVTIGSRVLGLSNLCLDM